MVTTDPAHFQALPWCAALLSDPNYTVAPSRIGKPDSLRRGEFFTRTLADNDAITACVYQTANARRAEQGKSSNGTESTTVSEVRAFFDTAAGVNGWPGVAHGGFVAAVIDEVMGFLIHSNKAATETAGKPIDTPFTVNQPQQQNIPLMTPGIAVMTAELTIKYRRPVPSGEALLVRAWIEGIQGRKISVQAAIEDGERQVLSEGFGLFLELKPGVKAPPVKRRNVKI